MDIALLVPIDHAEVEVVPNRTVGNRAVGGDAAGDNAHAVRFVAVVELRLGSSRTVPFSDMSGTYIVSPLPVALPTHLVPYALELLTCMVAYPATSGMK